MYIIDGGVHTDTTFINVIPGTEESYGPFATYTESLNVWRGRMGRMIDTCEHRLFIRPRFTGVVIDERADEYRNIGGIDH